MDGVEAAATVGRPTSPAERELRLVRLAGALGLCVFAAAFASFVVYPVEPLLTFAPVAAVISALSTRRAGDAAIAAAAGVFVGTEVDELRRGSGPVTGTPGYRPHGVTRRIYLSIS